MPNTNQISEKVVSSGNESGYSMILIRNEAKEMIRNLRKQETVHKDLFQERTICTALIEVAVEMMDVPEKKARLVEKLNDVAKRDLTDVAAKRDHVRSSLEVGRSKYVEGYKSSFIRMETKSNLKHFMSQIKEGAEVDKLC